MRFSLAQLEAFYESAETGSFSAAARKLGKAQSRISTAVADLEADLGVVLFDRSGKFPVLTEEGEQLLIKARGILDGCHDLTDSADTMARGEQVLLRFAIDELLPTSVMGKVLEAFSKQYPHIELEVLWGAMGDVATMVSTGRADVGIDMPAELLPSEKCSWRKLPGTDFCGVVAKDHPLAKKTGLTDEDFLPYRQLLAISRGGNKLPEDFRLSSSIWQCEDSRLIRELVRRGVGWAALARFQVAQDLREGRLVELSVIAGEIGLQNMFFFVWGKTHSLTEAEEWLANKIGLTLQKISE